MKKLKYWMPVDLYNGGMEHTTLHLLYSRFWYKFLSDIKVVPGNEPYARRHSHGMVLAEGGVKMSKSKGNVINPDKIVDEFGADTLRMYEMFMGPFEDAISWDTNGVRGVKRFIDKVWKYYNNLINNYDEETSDKAKNILNVTIRKVDKDIDNFRFNTSVSQMMVFMNFITRNDINIAKKDAKDFLKVLYPFAPHITEELWSRMGERKSISLENWPNTNIKVNASKLNIPVMINGKKRALLVIDASNKLSNDEIKEIALLDENVKRHVADKKIKKVIYIPGKIVSLVV
jgi:leucyl-tRNA synthetase